MGGGELNALEDTTHGGSLGEARAAQHGRAEVQIAKRRPCKTDPAQISAF